MITPLKPINQESMAPSERSEPRSEHDFRNPPQNENSTTRRRALSKREIMEELSRTRFPWDE